MLLAAYRRPAVFMTAASRVVSAPTDQR